MKRLCQLLEKGNRWSEEVSNLLKKIYVNCESCKKLKKTPARPKVTMLNALRFNDIVTVDLKEINKGKGSQYKYILYIIDSFTRFTVGVLIKSKKPEVIADAILRHWVGAGYGIMKSIHSDVGGEFANDIIEDIASNLNICVSMNAGYSPHQNGLNERNHHTVDRMIDIMMEHDKSLALEDALCWAINAKNALENQDGFTAFQLVFGASPNLPSATVANPPYLEGVTKSEQFAKHINALHAGRQAYIKCKADRKLKLALKSRINTRGDG